MAESEEGNKTRTPRASDTRETSKRSVSYDNTSTLPIPDPRDGLEYRYVRVMVRGEVDGRNYSQALRSGWTPVQKSDHPELEYVLSDFNNPLAEQVKDGIIIGGLILCCRDAEIGKKMRKAANDEVKTQIQALDRNYMKEGDERMPKFAENRSSVRFGD